MVYATPDDYTTVTGKAPPADATRLLDRASDLIRLATHNRGADHSPGAGEALKRATCFQVEFWLDVGEGVDITAPKGHTQAQGVSYVAPDRLAPRARNALLLEGLLYRGVGLG